MAAAPAGSPIWMLPDFTAFMISSSLLSRVPPKNCMSSSPFERLRTSSACQAKPTAPDSGTGMMCAITSFLTSARAKVGARPVARMVAMPPVTRLRRRTDTRLRLLIFIIVDMAPSQAIQFDWGNPIRREGRREAPGSYGR